MMLLGKIRKLLCRDRTAPMHSRRKGVIKERIQATRPFHVKYIGSTMVDDPILPHEKASEMARTIIRRGPRRNKRHVSLTITPKEIFVSDTISRCCLISFPMGEIGMVYAPPEDRRLFGVTVMDSDTSDCTFFLYKCTVRECQCENVEIMREYENMYEEYLKTEANDVIHEVDQTPDVMTLEEETESNDEIQANVNKSPDNPFPESEDEGETVEMKDEEDKVKEYSGENEGNGDEEKDEEEAESFSSKEEGIEMKEEEEDECDKDIHGENSVGDSDVDSEETGEDKEDGDNNLGEDKETDENGNACDDCLENEGEDPDHETDEDDHSSDSADEGGDAGSEEERDEESEDPVCQSPSPTRSGFSYLFTPHLSATATPGPQTVSSPPQPTPEDLDSFFDLRPQRPRRRISPYILNLIKQIEASLVESQQDSDQNSESGEEIEEQNF